MNGQAYGRSGFTRGASEGIRQRVWAGAWVALLLAILAFLVIYPMLLLLVGALTVIIWRNGAWFGLYEMVPGFLLSGVAIVLFSLLDKAPSMRMQQDFAQMEAEMANPGVSLTAPMVD